MEAIVIVLDIGKSTYNSEGCVTFLDEAKKCLSLIIQRKIFSESKDEIAIILLGTSDTTSKFSECDDEDPNISVVQDLQLASWELLEFVSEIKGTNVSTDFIKDSALLKALCLFQNPAKGKKILSRRILFFSSLESHIDSNKVKKICEELKGNQIELNVIGPVACPVENIGDGQHGQRFQDDSLLTVKEENALSLILREASGESYSFSDVLPALVYYQKKKVQAVPWNGNLDIGTNLTIPVSTYTKVSENKPKTWKSAYAFKLGAKVERGVSYYMNDELQTKVSKDEIIPAFKYGSTLVPYSEADKKNMDYEPDEKGIKVLGFTKVENVQRYYYIGEKTMYVFGQKNRELAGEILAPFIQALHDTRMVAIVRYVYSLRSAPKIGFLAPKIKPDYECLVFIVLPFMEDMHHFVFPSLESDSKNVPTDEQLKAVDDLIDAMNLSSSVSEDEEETLKPKTLVNPYFQRLYQCLQFRAFYPEKPLPEIDPHIQSILNPSPKLLKRSEPCLKKLSSLFLTKEILPKKTTDTKSHVLTNGKVQKSAENLCDDFSSKEKIVTEDKLFDAITDKIIEVGSINPVRDFKYLINNNVLPFNDVCQQMMDVVSKFLQDSSNLRTYHAKILSICKELRNASLKVGNAVKYNLFMTNLQNLLLDCDEELWNKIKDEKIGLISKNEISSSTVSSDQAEKFLARSVASDEGSHSAAKSFEINEDDDYDNLLDQL